MEFKAIELNVDQSKEIYASANCQQLINTMYEYYPKIGFNKPWIGYFAFNNNQVVGTGGFTGQPKDGKVVHSQASVPSLTEFCSASVQTINI